MELHTQVVVTRPTPKVGAQVRARSRMVSTSLTVVQGICNHSLPHSMSVKPSIGRGFALDQLALFRASAFAGVIFTELPFGATVGFAGFGGCRRILRACCWKFDAVDPTGRFGRRYRRAHWRRARRRLRRDGLAAEELRVMRRVVAADAITLAGRVAVGKNDVGCDPDKQARGNE